jgi:hypothetical protein
VPADNTGDAGEAGAESEDENEHELDLHAGGSQYVAVVDARADDHPDPRAIERQPHRNADHDGWRRRSPAAPRDSR